MNLNELNAVIQKLGEYYTELKNKKMYSEEIEDKIYNRITGIDYFYDNPEYSFSELEKFKEEFQYYFYCTNRCIEILEGSKRSFFKIGNHFGVKVIEEKSTFSMNRPDGSTGHYKEYQFNSSPHFVGFSSKKYNEICRCVEHNIKFYFNIDQDNIMPLLNDLLKLSIDEDIEFYVKSRPINCNDMVTLRIIDPEKISILYEVIQKYKIPFQTTPILPLDKEGIGIVLDNNNSFNEDVTKMLCNYFESNTEFNVGTFIDYWQNKLNQTCVFSYNIENVLEYNPNLLNDSIEKLQQLNKKIEY